MKSYLLAGLLLVCACAGTEAGNPSFAGTLEYTAYTSDSAVAALSADGAAPRVNAAWLVLGDVRFVPAGTCDRARAELGSPGLGIGNHASGHVTKARLELEADAYCGLRLPFERAGDDVGNAPPALRGHSVLVEGTLADGTAFSIRSQLKQELFLDAGTHPFELSAGAGTLLLGFDVATWLDGLDLADAQRDAGGIVIDAAHNADLLSGFEAQLALGTLLYRDDAGRGRIEAGATPLARGAP